MKLIFEDKEAFVITDGGKVELEEWVDLTRRNKPISKTQLANNTGLPAGALSPHKDRGKVYRPSFKNLIIALDTLGYEIEVKESTQPKNHLAAYYYQQRSKKLM